jgi:hypothetical protein
VTKEMAVDRMREQRLWQSLPPKVKRGIVAVKENAEIIDGRIYDKDGNDRSDLLEVNIKTTDKQIRALKAVDELSAHEIENGGFVFAFFERYKTMEERFPSLTQSDMARLMFIGTYTAYNTGRLQQDNGRVIDKRALKKLLDISDRLFRDFYKKLLAENIISEQPDGLYINPSVFYRGEIGELDYDLSSYQQTRLFRKTVRQLYAEYNGRTIKQLAIIYAVLPFLNFKYNVVCFNPTESDEDKVRPMDLGNLAALLGYKDATKLKQALERIKLNDKPVFYMPHNINDKRQRRIIVNPRVVFAGPAESLSAIKVLFN